ncbi:MAG: cobyric acid synthase, partial [Oceanococcus sp.]
EMHAGKILRNVQGRLLLEGGVAVRGYEIHGGRSQGPDLTCPLIENEYGLDGAISADGQILGTYLHGLFDHPEALCALLRWSGLTQVKTFDIAANREAAITRLADCLEAHLDLPAIDAIWQGAA